MFDLRRRGIVNKLSIAGTSGDKWSAVEQHFEENIAGAYKEMDCSLVFYPLFLG